MRVLLIHNYYGSSAPSGENEVVKIERSLLERRGNEVLEFSTHSDKLISKGAAGTMVGALGTPWNLAISRRLKQQVQRFRPDVVHVHNTFPLLSPAVFYAIGSRAARVHTLHNYRLFCAAAIPMRNGLVCTDCLDRKSVWHALKYGCYRKSRLATAPLAISIALHRQLGTWTNQVDAFITLSEFQREKMVDAGLPSARVHVKPNFYAGNPTLIRWDMRDESVVFAGRLSEEKGIETLIRAWILWGSDAPELRILGDGPLRGRVEGMIDGHEGARIRLLGYVPSQVAEFEIARAKLVVVPSQSFEGFPMVIREAFAFATGVAASSVGPLPSIVREGGVLFEPGSTESLLACVKELWQKPDLLRRLSDGARRSFLECYSEDVNYDALLKIYECAMESQRARSDFELS